MPDQLPCCVMHTGQCMACGRPFGWFRVKPHFAAVTGPAEVGSLCTRCWEERTPEARLPYYLQDCFGACAQEEVAADNGSWPWSRDQLRDAVLGGA